MRYRTTFPQLDGELFLTDGGIETEHGVDIRADDVPDGINAAAHAAGLSSSLDNLAASVER